MIDVAPPLTARMGGEDLLSLATVVFGDGPPNLPRDFIAESDKPKSARDYPLRRCGASGHLGAPHATVRVDGRWYLRRYCPDARRK